jgi:tRNA(adenine34) deaminase
VSASTTGDDQRWMEHALRLAEYAAQEGEVPVGAVMVCEGELLAEGWNRPISTFDPTAHAEIVTLRAAAQRLRNYRLGGTTLYVTLEPCPMCAGAMVHARVQRLVFGAADRLAGAAGSVFDLLAAPTLNHRVVVEGGVLADECGGRLKAFFQARR